MKSEKLYDAITDVREDLVTEARPAQKRPARKRWLSLTAAGLAAMLAVSLLLPSEKTGSPLVPSAGAVLLSEAEYPEMAPYPDESAYFKADGTFDDDAFYDAFKVWYGNFQDRWVYRERNRGLLDHFFTESLSAFLGDNGGENRVYSPLNVYLALGMLAEITDGDSRAQLLSLLDCPDMETLRQRAGDLWNANYCNDGATVSTLAASVWLDEDIAFRQETLDTLAQSYYASSYQGQMGAGAMNGALQGWLNEQTGGLLAQQAGNMELSAETVMALATTIYFRARWSDEFSESRTDTATFHGTAGDTECEFMHRSWSNTYYWAENFGAVSERLESGGEMWFLLPDEGVSPEELLQSGAAEFLLQGGDEEHQKFLTVNFSVPKFDVSSGMDLQTGLKSLGVTDAFDPLMSDFSPLAEGAEGLFVSQVRHDARVAIDEEGVTAAAFSVIAAAGSAMPPTEEVDFVLDRPFLFAITGADDTILFVGIVNQV